MSNKDFSQTIIYNIKCKDPKIQKSFFGHTISMKSKKYMIKRNLINGVRGEIYDTIRENGGMKNWDFVLLEHFSSCTSQASANCRVVDFSTKSNPILIPNNPILIPNSEKSTTLADHNISEPSQIVCPSCGSKFSFRQNLSRHQKKSCKNRPKIDPMVQLQERVEKQQKEIEELKQSQLSKSIINNNNTQNNNTQNNNTQNNNIIIELGKENLMDVLSKKQKKRILSKLFCSLEYLVEYVHCNPKFPQFRNISVPSLSKSYCNTYSEKHNKFIASNTKDIIERIVNYRTEDIQSFLEDAKENGEEVSEKTETAIKTLIDKIENDPQYKKEKCEIIRCVIHNNDKS